MRTNNCYTHEICNHTAYCATYAIVDACGKLQSLLFSHLFNDDVTAVILLRHKSVCDVHALVRLKQ